jgi:hypothetical protein
VKRSETQEVTFAMYADPLDAPACCREKTVEGN